MYLEASKSDFLMIEEKKEKRVTPRHTASILLRSSTLQFSMLYIESDAYCVYDQHTHVYVEFSRVGFTLLVAQLLDLAMYPPLTDYDYIKRVVDNLGLSRTHAKLGLPIVNNDYLVFADCIYDLKNKCTTRFTTKLLIFSYLPFNYTGNKEMPVFLQFLEEFCEGHVDRIEFIRNYFYVIINGPGRLQIFFHFHGPGGTGKSTLSNISQCLVGKESVVSVDLKRITKDPFEALNLANKKIILVSESSSKLVDTAVLKKISGGDPLSGRKKHVQGSFDIFVEGVVVIFNNDNFDAHDDSGALIRRIRPFLAKGKVKVKKDLIRHSKRDGWKGSIIKEIPSIVTWATELEEEDVFNFFDNIETTCPSLAGQMKINKLAFNPILSWIAEQIVPGNGLYVGMISHFTPKDMIDMKQRKIVYPVYQYWCKNHGLTPIEKKVFSVKFGDYLEQAGIKGSVIRRGCGLFVTGIDLHEDVFLLDHQMGSPLWHGGKESISDNGKPGYVQVTNSHHPAIGPDLREKYIAKLGKSPLKDILNKVCTEQMNDQLIPELVNTFSKNFKLRDKTYLASVTKQISDGVNKVNLNGGIPYKWKDCGGSPRIIPQGYGKSINFTKRVVRDKSYEIMGVEAKKHGFTIVDLDITSCYLAVLLGLCSAELHSIQLMVETSNIWIEIEKQFVELGKGDLFNKPAVKICVYASYFLGGSKAMSHGIHENIRKSTGLTPKDYRDSSYHASADQIANDVITVMKCSDIIAQLKATSKALKEANLGQLLTGPTGNTWLVTEEDWGSTYANYLISFEIALLGKSTLNVIDKYPTVEVIGHFHDGCVLAIPTENFDEIVKYHQDQIAKVGNDIGLQYTQKLEIKAIY